MSCTQTAQLPPIVITSEDYDRLYAFAEVRNVGRQAVRAYLKRELDRADICGPWDLSGVAMGMFINFRIDDEAAPRTARLCYPRRASREQGISILSPIGAALIGMLPGHSIEWLEDGHIRHLTVEDYRWFRESIV